ncbi:MAG: 4Fe-4S dicluster domain-containing protein [Defluviitaleaceae bacterium]|nr:4Fe-4S dicluster domain-containing protein [Defluviitaleaceae bacterium]
MHIQNDYADQIRLISGSQDLKCMKCGRCSASCPQYEEMDVRPHQFVSYLQRGDIDALMDCESIWKCLSCFACVERCPRDVKPARLIEAARLLRIRRQSDDEFITPEQVPALLELDPDIPQQLLASVFRKYVK